MEQTVGLKKLFFIKFSFVRCKYGLEVWNTSHKVKNLKCVLRILSIKSSQKTSDFMVCSLYQLTLMSRKGHITLCYRHAQLNFITLVLFQHILELDCFHLENAAKNDCVVIILSHVHKYMLQSHKKIHCLFGKCWFPFAAQNFIVYDPPVVAMN